MPPTKPDHPRIRPLESAADYEACVTLQRATWGDDFRELVPPALLQVAQKMGGILAGAFDGDRLIGFVFGLTGLRAGSLAHWSHMLAVDTAWRDRGVGRQLKAYQRERLLAAGITRMFWTFDPLVARNAHLNLERLGATVVEYVRDMYGANPMSRADSIICSDRFVVEWNLGPTGQRAGGPTGGRADAPVIETAQDPLPDVTVVRVAIPDDVQALKLTAPEAALAWRRSTRRAFEHYLPRGYRVTTFARRVEDRPAAYRLERA